MGSVHDQSRTHARIYMQPPTVGRIGWKDWVEELGGITVRSCFTILTLSPAKLLLSHYHRGWEEEDHDICNAEVSSLLKGL